MKYCRPIVWDLRTIARTAEGAMMPNCVSGGAAAGSWESCAVGTGAHFACKSGSTPMGYDICVGGASPGASNDCYSGGGVTGEGNCENGGTGYSDPYSCHTGPSYTEY